jgi:hypothetical protein
VGKERRTALPGPAYFIEIVVLTPLACADQRAVTVLVWVQK